MIYREFSLFLNRNKALASQKTYLFVFQETLVYPTLPTTVDTFTLIFFIEIFFVLLPPPPSSLTFGHFALRIWSEQIGDVAGQWDPTYPRLRLSHVH